jgi:uncharacterized protein (UPF0303 family)
MLSTLETPFGCINEPGHDTKAALKGLTVKSVSEPFDGSSAPSSQVPAQLTQERQLSMDPDLACVIDQERSLCFSSFDEGTAFSIGCAIRSRGLKAGHPLVIDIRLNDRRMFFAGLPGSTISLSDWVRRKINTVKTFHKSTYRIVLEKPRPDMLFEPMHNLPASDYVVVGGAFPIIVRGTGVVGAVGVAGASMRDDHTMIVEAMCEHIGIDYRPLALPPVASE